ncbi:hypothetical protein C1646_750622 [Rhizophagus diaphanus]|nr:hypothetical protein C1646_750622 [Rhizophagus diaphanus] [Rhizophagus sp. MUCL 43196]
MNHEIQKEYKEIELIGRIHEFMTLYAVEIPQDELLANSHDQIIQGETFADIKIRLQFRLDDDIIVSEKELSNTEYLGLDYVDETESMEKITYIRG